MGYGHYSTDAYHRLQGARGYDRMSRTEIFASRGLDPEMDPRTVIVRESRDSADHPMSLPIVVGLDVTGSMGFVPEQIVRHGLPTLMDTMLNAGIADPQVLFAGIGDFIYDRAPLQVGQFESSAELLDRWLTKVYIESGGGGNNQESYNLAYLFAARHTATDAWDRRRQKGFVFTIGDEPCAQSIPADIISRHTTGRTEQAVSTSDIIAEAQQRYNVYHLHIVHDEMSRSERRMAGWRELLGTNFIVVENPEAVSATIASVVVARLEADRIDDADAAGDDWSL